MAVKLIAHEPNLYLTVWTPFVDAAQINTAMRQIYQQVEAAGEARYVVIADLTELKRIPFEIRGVRTWLDDDPRALAFINVASPSIMAPLRSVFQQIMLNKIGFATTREEALALARGVLFRDEPITA
jgi:hypothetical protein